MPRLILACLGLAILFCLLCGPVFYVALQFWQRGDPGALRALRPVCIAQVALACGLFFVVDGIGMRNPVGGIVAVMLGVSIGGALLYGGWRLLVRAVAR